LNLFRDHRRKKNSAWPQGKWFTPALTRTPSSEFTPTPWSGEEPLEISPIQVRLAYPNAWMAYKTGVHVALTLEGKRLEILQAGH